MYSRGRGFDSLQLNLKHVGNAVTFFATSSSMHAIQKLLFYLLPFFDFFSLSLLPYSSVAICEFLDSPRPMKIVTPAGSASSNSSS